MKLLLLVSRLPEFKSFEELELPKHSKVKRQSSASNSPELEQQPDVTVAEWKNRPTQDILQKLQVRSMPLQGARGRPRLPLVLSEEVAVQRWVAHRLSVPRAGVGCGSPGLREHGWPTDAHRKGMSGLCGAFKGCVGRYRRCVGAVAPGPPDASAVTA